MSFRASHSFGRAPVWTPAQLPGLMFMHDADDSRNALSSDTAFLFDVSGNGKHANKTISKSRPICTAEPLLNGRKLVRFDATQSLTVPAVARPRFIFIGGRPMPGGSAGYCITGCGLAHERHLGRRQQHTIPYWRS
jgi:hypothetical protein